MQSGCPRYFYMMRLNRAQVIGQDGCIIL